MNFTVISGDMLRLRAMQCNAATISIVILLFGFMTIVAACAKKVEEEVVYVDEPVSSEPVYTGKYK